MANLVEVDLTSYLTMLHLLTSSEIKVILLKLFSINNSCITVQSTKSAIEQILRSYWTTTA